MYIWNRLLLFYVLVFMAMLSGCAHTMRGEPKDALDVVVTIEHTGQTVADLNGALDVKARNSVIETRMMMLDRSYSDYVAAINQERTRSKLGIQLSELLLSIGGTVTGSGAERKTFAAASSILKGGDAIVDSTIFYEQTIVALVAAMEASRARIRLRINSSMNSELTHYTRSQAYQDLEDYANAGTLLGAIRYVQAQAEADRKNTEVLIDSNVRLLHALSAPERNIRICATDALAPSNANRTIVNMIAVAKALGLTLDSATEKDAGKLAVVLQDFVRQTADKPRYDKIDTLFNSNKLYPESSPCKK